MYSSFLGNFCRYAHKSYKREMIIWKYALNHKKYGINKKNEMKIILLTSLSENVFGCSEKSKNCYEKKSKQHYKIIFYLFLDILFYIFQYFFLYLCMYVPMRTILCKYVCHAVKPPLLYKVGTNFIYTMVYITPPLHA